MRKRQVARDLKKNAAVLAIGQSNNAATQENATWKSALTQLRGNGDVDDDSDWLHRNDAYQRHVIQQMQTHPSIILTRTPGIMVHTVLFSLINVRTTLMYSFFG